jgi:MFS family permease
MFRSLRNANYRLYASGAAVSNIGTWVQRIAQDWLVLQLSGNSGTVLGITTGLQFLPFLLFAPLGGILADRFSKRRVLQVTLGAAGLTAAALAVLDLSNTAQVWHVYVLAFLLGTADALGNPSKQSFVVEMVGKKDLPNAVALNSASFNGARIIGPAVAGLLIVLIGTGWVIMINAVSYVATIWVLAKMRTDQLQPSDPVPRKKGMTREGLRYLRGRPDLVLLLWVVFFVGCFGLNFQLTSALMATEVFGKGAGEFGILATFMAFGSLGGALLAARRGRPRLRTIVIGAAVFGLVEVAAGLMPTYATYALVLPAMGLASMTMITAANTMMQMSVVPEMRGRTMAVYGMVFIGSTPLGSPIIGWIGDAIGPRWTLIIGGGVSVLGTVVAAYFLGIRKRISIPAQIRAQVSGRTVKVEPAQAEPAQAEEVGLSVDDEKLSEWKLPTTSDSSKPTLTASRMWPPRVLTPPFRRVRAGRSVTR